MRQQGTWMKWEQAMERVTWKDIWKWNPQRIKFLIQGVYDILKVQGFFICHIINYTGYNQKWNVESPMSIQAVHMGQNRNTCMPPLFQNRNIRTHLEQLLQGPGWRPLSMEARPGPQIHRWGNQYTLPIYSQGYLIHQGRTKAIGSIEKLLCRFALHSPLLGNDSRPGEAAENSNTHHPVQIETWHHLGLWGHKTTDLVGANSALGGEDGGSREKEGEIPRTGGGLLEEQMDDQVNASRGGQQGICKSLPEQGLLGIMGDNRKKSHRQQRGGSRKSFQMALVEEGRAVGAVECHLNTGRGLISLGRVARTRVSVVRPETPSNSWTDDVSKVMHQKMFSVN